MGKVLRVLVIIVMLLGLAAVFLAAVNFKKREVLIGRTHALEEMFVKLARTLEAGDPPEVPQPAYPQRDLSPVTSREVENPERSAFWDAYNHKLEPAAQPVPTLDYSSQEKRLQLREFYRTDPATGKPAIDPLSGQPATKGAGTQDELLNQAFDRAKNQYALLNQTRAELVKVRDELIATVEEVNRLKQEGRADKRVIEERDARIAQLDREKRDLETQKTRLEEELQGLRAELQESNETIDKQKEEMQVLSGRIADLERKNKELIGKGTIIPTTLGQLPDDAEGRFTPGVHGKIVSFNEQWKFAVVEFSDEFMAQLTGSGRDQPMPPLEVMVKRPGFKGAAGEFITRLKLRQVIQEQNLVVADILTDWQQVPLENGDAVFF
jgi:hypothetical protein